MQITDVNVAAAAVSREQYASTTFKVTVKYVNKFQSDAFTKLFVKIVVPKVNAFSDGNSYDTGKRYEIIDSIFYKICSFQELNMYVNTLPEMQRLFSLNGENVELAPRWLIA